MNQIDNAEVYIYIYINFNKLFMQSNSDSNSDNSKNNIIITNLKNVLMKKMTTFLNLRIPANRYSSL